MKKRTKRLVVALILFITFALLLPTSTVNKEATTTAKNSSKSVSVYEGKKEEATEKEKTKSSVTNDNIFTNNIFTRRIFVQQAYNGVSESAYYSAVDGAQINELKTMTLTACVSISGMALLIVMVMRQRRTRDDEKY